MSERTFWKCVACFVAGTLFGVLLVYATRPPTPDYQALLRVGMEVECCVDRDSLMKGSHNTFNVEYMWTFTNRTDNPVSLTFPPLAICRHCYDSDGLTPTESSMPLEMSEPFNEPRTITIPENGSVSLNSKGAIGTKSAFPSRRTTFMMVFGPPPSNPDLPPIPFVGTLAAEVHYTEK